MSLVYIYGFWLILQGALAKHGDDCEDVGDCPALDNAIVNVEVTYSDHLCDQIRRIDCKDHHLVHDERICGTDGVTYISHCRFAKARCHSLNSGTHLDVANHGACVITTAAPATTVAKTTVAVYTNKVTTDVDSSTPIVTDTSTLPTTTMTDLPTVATTTQSVHNILLNVFCQQSAHINCSMDFDIVCGSDGTFYPNICELSKTQCENPTLQQAEMSTCHLPPL